MTEKERGGMAEAGEERDDDWHRREYVRRLRQNRERGLASGPAPTLAEIERRERGPVSESLAPRPAPREAGREQRRPRSWRKLLWTTTWIAVAAAAVALKRHSFKARDRAAHLPIAAGASR